MSIGITVVSVSLTLETLPVNVGVGMVNGDVNGSLGADMSDW